jgi:hypothetical protein
MSRFEEILLEGSVDSSNSTATPLGIGGVFTGTSRDILNCGVVFVNVYADVASATDGLSIQQSSDNSNWDHTDDYTIAAGANKNFSINPHSRYLRVVYTNGGVGQAAFRLQTVCKTQNAKPSSHRVKDEIIGDDDVTLVKAALTGENGSGLWHNVKTDADGNLYITNRGNGLAIAAGEVTGTSFVHKFGSAPDFDTADGSVYIWDGADDGGINQMQYTFSTTADIDSISSDNNGDTQDVEIQGLDTNYDLVVQTITMTGQTRKALDTDLVRIFRMKNVGATDFAGQVYCYVNTAITTGTPNDKTKIRAMVDNGNNQTLMAMYTVPNGKTAYLRDWFASIAGASKSSNYIIDIFARPFGEVFQLKHRSAISDTGSSHIQHQHIEPAVYAGKTDVIMKVEGTAGGMSGATVSAGFDIVLIDD